jgi:hypothetical protein
LALALLLTIVPMPAALSQVGPGASLTVLRGSVAVSRPDGTAVYPAGTGLTLAVGDMVGTLDRTRALVTFFTGSEVELGSNTTIVIRRLDRDLLDEARVTIENVSGMTVIRVPQEGPPESAVRILSGDTVARVLSGEAGHGVDPTTNNITVACVDGQFRCRGDGVSFPYDSAFLSGAMSRTRTGKGDVVDTKIPAGASIWDVLSDGASVGSDSDDTATNASSPNPSSSHANALRSRSEADTPNASQAAATPTSTATVTPTVTGTATGTASPTTTATPTRTPTVTVTPTVTATPTRTPTFTATPTATPPPGTPGPACGTTHEVTNADAVTTTVHLLGRSSGTLHFSWDAFANPDKFDLIYEGTQIFTTGGFVSNTGAADVAFGPGTSTYLTVVVTTGAGSNHWLYQIDCLP